MRKIRFKLGDLVTLLYIENPEVSPIAKEIMENYGIDLEDILKIRKKLANRDYRLLRRDEE
ncbi:MAG: hypothetical protein GXO63_02030 [Candidatus Micrarchaeota archaeon]|nr:hypothetical protein [Candidatus Micrarchaeota archaeon]